jgi:hypothetical protein
MGDQDCFACSGLVGPDRFECPVKIGSRPAVIVTRMARQVADPAYPDQAAPAGPAAGPLGGDGLLFGSLSVPAGVLVTSGAR